MIKLNTISYQKPSTEKSTIKLIMALMASKNISNVKMVMGIVRMMRIGFTITLAIKMSADASKN